MKKMIAVIDYGMGNLRSVQKALELFGAKAVITQNPREIKNAEKLVLPGVGAMPLAMESLNALKLIPALKDGIKQNKPFLGICLGLQLLFSESAEGGKVKGIGLLSGQVKKFSDLKVPHIGWNQIKNTTPLCPLFKGVADGSFFYFCHSYYVVPKEASIVATKTEYGVEFTSGIWKENIFGVQFHPEKSQALGLKILENFVNL